MSKIEITDDGMAVLERARRAWVAAGEFRRRRDRFKRFTYGDQWSDRVTDGFGGTVSEEQYIVNSGKRPLINNLIRQLVKTVVGRYRAMCADDGVYSAEDIAAVACRNALADLDARVLEEFLISGCAVQRVDNVSRHSGPGVYVDFVDPRNFFVNAYRDPRGWDVELVGQLHDMSMAEVLNRFGKGDRGRVAILRRLYSSEATLARSLSGGGVLGITTPASQEFVTPAEAGKCRVIEVWTLDSREILTCHDPERDSVEKVEAGSARARVLDSENRRRAKDATRMPMSVRNDMHMFWRCRWFAPDGTLLDSYESPYAHGTHPYALRFYPLTDGEVHPFVEDVIDQQKFINRLIVQLDHILGSSAKGVLLFPVDQLPKNVSWEDVQRNWAACNGIIPITGRGEMPSQVVANAANSGAYELLSLQMKLFEQISGVSEALTGRNMSGTTGAELYAAQVRNATLALTDLLDTFAAFRADRDKKMMNM